MLVVWRENTMSSDCGPSPVVPRRRVPTARQRYLAATIRVEADRKLRRVTPDWIVQIASEGEKRFG